MDLNEAKKESNAEESQNRNRSSSEPKDIPTGNGARQRTVSSSSDNAAEFPLLVPASPPSFISFEQLLKAAEDVSKSEFDMALAHEIAVNVDFQVQKNIPKSSLEQQVSEICHKAFWDLLQFQLSSDPPNYTHAMVLLKEIKEILHMLLLPHSARLKNEINEVLDVELIEQQAKKGVIDVHSYAQFIISTMARMCSPARDSNIEELRKLTDIVPLYKNILETLELMKLDMANFTITNMRPLIQQQSVEYEKKKFKEILQSLEDLTPSIDGLKFTRLWLWKVYEEVMDEMQEQKPQNSMLLRKAYVTILNWKETEKFPETLHLDHERFINLRHKFNVIIITATIILVTLTSVGPSIQGISSFKETLKKHLLILLADIHQCSSEELETKMEGVGLQIAKEVNECLESHGYPTLNEDEKARLIASIKNISDDKHHVRQLIRKRLLEFLELSLHTTSNLKIPPGLSSLNSELSTFAGQFFALVRHNQLVFGDYYNDIMESFTRT